MVMNPSLIPFLILGKALGKVTRLSGSGGTALPGLVSSKLNPKLTRILSDQISNGAILVTGTNGKTTTSRILGNILSKNNLTFIHNRSGSNLLRGISTELINRSSWGGELKSDWAVFEVDEFALPHALEQVKTKIVIVNNLFRDQLDRYGELENIRKRWQDSLRQLDKNTIVILNSDDPTVAHLGKDLKARVLYFGLEDKEIGFKDPPHASDSLKCQNCSQFLYFEAFYLAHMGNYSCKVCNFSRPSPQVFASNIKLKGTTGSEFELTMGENKIKVNLDVPGIFNIYNALAAVTAAAAVGLNVEEIEQGFADLKPAFGRGENIEVDSKQISMFLVKNPAGFNEIIRLLTLDKDKKTLLIAINDLIADGKDVSWLWDVDVEKLKGSINKIVASGVRAWDMRLRLKYANLDLDKTDLFVEEDLDSSIKLALSKVKKGETLYILPTYTAMLQIRKILSDQGVTERFWED